MASYIYSKWINNPSDCPAEFYSELDSKRLETRKIEIFKNGKVGFASSNKATKGTRLGIEPVPSINEIRSQAEFEVKEISKAEFDAKWAELAHV